MLQNMSRLHGHWTIDIAIAIVIAIAIAMDTMQVKFIEIMEKKKEAYIEQTVKLM